MAKKSKKRKDVLSTEYALISLDALHMSLNSGRVDKALDIIEEWAEAVEKLEPTSVVKRRGRPPKKGK